MIIFDLICLDANHRFEGWFGSSQDYADQHDRGLLDCPVCGSKNIAKAAMAPNLGRKGRFAARARDIHYGDADDKPIHGTASQEEVADLAEEGIAALPLPLPVLPPESKN